MSEVIVVEGNVAKTWINALTRNSERYIQKTGRQYVIVTEHKKYPVPR